MKIEDIRVGLLVMISSPIEEEMDGIKRRKGAMGVIDAQVYGSAGIWWWIIHRDGSQVKYRYCEISEIKTIKVPAEESGLEF